MELFDQPQNNQCVTIIVFRALTIYNRGGPGTVCINYKPKGGSKEIGPPSSSATVTDEWAALANSLASLDPKHKAFFEKGERRTIEYSLGEPASDVEVSD